MHERYAGLRERLITDGRNEIVLDFDEFDVFLLGGLPLSAARDPSWWANDDRRPENVQVHAWLDAGYCIQSVDLDARTVRFRRQDTPQRGDLRTRP